jgi:hypothetical protein
MKKQAVLGLIALFFVSYSKNIYAQGPLSITTKNHCSYAGKAWEDDLYRFDGNANVESQIKEILKFGGAESNFSIVRTNVENVAAVVDNGQRYLLYSGDFVEKNAAMDVYAALAHEIGHLVNKHTLESDRKLVEESEADFFMGYVLSKKGVPKAAIESILNKFALASGVSIGDRRQSIFDGFEKATLAVEINGLQFGGDPETGELTLPTFEFKSCYTTSELPKMVFANKKTLGQVDEQLQKGLTAKGFAERRYFSVKNGYAIVTQMEQYNKKDASSRNDHTRWLDYPARSKFSGVMDYLTSVILPNKGYFRLFVFVVTNEAFKSTDAKVSKKEAAAWLSQGANRLPKLLAEMPYTEGYAVNVLVYEFEVPESNRAAKQVCPTSKFNAAKHLEMAGLNF